MPKFALLVAAPPPSGIPGHMVIGIDASDGTGLYTLTNAGVVTYYATVDAAEALADAAEAAAVATASSDATTKANAAQAAAEATAASDATTKANAAQAAAIAACVQLTGDQGPITGVKEFTTPKTQATTFAALPSAVTVGAGARGFITDGSTTLILGIGLPAAGGGANSVPVYSDGAQWVVG